MRPYQEILNLYDFFKYDSDLYIATELCTCDLQKAIADQKAKGENEYFPEDMIRKALAQLLQAILRLHGRQIMHRDIKPQNILVRSVNPLQLCLADFDVSMNLRGTNLQVSKKNFAGTAGFFSTDMKDGATAKDYSFPVDL